MVNQRGPGTDPLAKEKYAVIFERAAVAMAFSRVQDGLLADANDAWLELYGFKREECIGRSTTELGLYENQSDRERFREKALKEGRVRDMEARMLSRSRGQFLVRINGHFIDIDGEKYFLTTHEDVTAMRASEDNLKASELRHREMADANGRLYWEARMAVTARDELLSIASHELKTPLTTLQIQATLRADDVERGDFSRFAPGKIEKLIADDLRQIERLTRLVNDMLDFSRIQGGKLSLVMQKFDFSEMAREVVQRLQPHVTPGSSSITVDAPSPAVGEWDQFRMEQVLINLITNALKYGQGKPIQVKVAVDGSYVRALVIDQGIGIKKEDHLRIFEQYERAVSVAEVSGFGMGLFIAKKLVDAQGGRLWVESELGRGATFTLEVPMRQAT